VLSVKAGGDGVPLTMKSRWKSARRKLAYKLRDRAGEKRGVRDGGHRVGPGQNEPAVQDDRPEFRHAATCRWQKATLAAPCGRSS